MSCLDTNGIKHIQTKIKCHIDELEEKVKNSRIYWNESELKFDQDFVQNFIDGHYNEIVHHLNEIRHHLEQIGYHKKELEVINSYLPGQKQPERSLHHDEEQNQDQELAYQQEQSEDITLTTKRPEEEKSRLKTRRASRSASLKYVLQWEKMLDEQKGESSINAIKRKSKSGSNLGTLVESENGKISETDVSKFMVTSRVRQFEGFHKPKRVSSTMETFLDSSNGKPKRVTSYPILERLDEECEPERPKSCEGFMEGNGDSEDKEEVPDEQLVPREDGEQKSTNSDLEEKPLGKNVEKVAEDSINAETEGSHEKQTLEKEENNKTVTEKSQIEETAESKATAALNTDDKEEEKEEETILMESASKPRIVEVHYKQQ